MHCLLGDEMIIVQYEQHMLLVLQERINKQFHKVRQRWCLLRLQVGE